MYKTKYYFVLLKLFNQQNLKVIYNKKKNFYVLFDTFIYFRLLKIEKHFGINLS